MAEATAAVHLVVVAGVFVLMSGASYSLPPSAPNYETKIACEGSQLQLSCEEGTKINLIRANFGRFSISICNTQGNLEWSVNCMARRSFRVIQEVCGNRSECLLFASSAYFGDPCPGVNKYLEVHYQCLPESNAKPAATERRTAGKNFSPHKRKQPVVATSRTEDSDVATKDVASSSYKNLSSATQPSSTFSPILMLTAASPPAAGALPSASQTTGSSAVTPVVTPPPAAPAAPLSEAATESASPTASAPSVVSAAGSRQEQMGISSNRNNNFRVSDSATDQVAGSRDALQPSLSHRPHGGRTSPAYPVLEDEDYEGTSSPLDSMDRTGSSAALPLSEHLRLLLTIGCVFSVICLFLTMLSLVLTAFPATSSPSHHPQHHVTHQHHHASRRWRLELQVKQNLTLCLLLVQILFLIGINLSQNRFFCGIVSGTLHYFFLSIFIWLFFDGFTLYLALLKQQEDDVPPSSSSVISSCASKNKPCRCYLVLAYGLPLLIQLVSSLLDTGSLLLISSSPTHCWLRSDKYFVLTFVGPVIAVLSANFLFLAITVVCSNYGSLFNFDKSTPFPTAASLASESSLRRRLRTSLTVFVAMSLTLTALFVSLCQELPEDEIVFTSCLYVFAILNPIQALVIVVLFSSSSSVPSNSIKVLSSLGFLSDSKSDNHPMHGSHFSHKDGMLVASAAAQHYNANHEVNQPEPMIPLPHASASNLADIEREESVQSKAYTASDYGFRRNLAALNYRSPVYGSAAAADASAVTLSSRVRSSHGHVHTKHCLQFPCQYPHVVEHVYESIDEDPYIARLLMPIPTPLIGRKAQSENFSGNAATVLPAIIRDNTNHSTIICCSSTPAARASSIKSHLVSQCQTVQQQQQQQQQRQQQQQQQSDQSTAAKLRQESTLI